MTTADLSQRVTVAITGAAGYLGSAVVEALCDDDRVGSVVGFDLVLPSFRHPKFVPDIIDVRDPALATRLPGVDVVIHLAFVMDPIKDEADMRDVNVNGSQNVFRAAGRAGVKKIVYTSSGVAYGAHADNDRPLTEESPLRANLDFSYAAHKLEVEYVVREFRDEFPQVAVVVLRPATVLGANVDSAWSHLLELPLLVGVQGHSPPFQFVHEDDVRDALLFAVFAELEGAYNLAAPDQVDAADAIRMVGRRRLDLPEPLAFALTERLWDLGLAEAPAGMIHYVMHPWVMSTDKLAAAGFRPRCSSREALEAAVAAHHDHVRVGRRRFRRSRINRGGLAGLGLVGAVVGARAVRRAWAS